VERIQKILSQAGVASRRASEQLMLEGRVSVNGATIKELGTKADPSKDDIRVDGRRIKLPDRHRYLLLNKPRGYVTTRSDPQKRPTVIDLVGIREYIYPVGRLDFDSEGLLLLTNDGDWAAHLTHPRHGVERVYQARVLGVPDDHDLDRLRRGIVIDGRRTEPAAVQLLNPHSRPGGHARTRGAGGPNRSADVEGPRSTRSPLRRGAPRDARTTDAHRRSTTRTESRSHEQDRALERRLSRAAEGNATLQITVREGRNRQVRKMLDAIGHPVDHLERIAIGPIRDSRLKPGQWRELTAEEVKKLRAAGQTTRPRAGSAPDHEQKADRKPSRN
jgi:23S rRNA pseudouridine2605 synthase